MVKTHQSKINFLSLLSKRELSIVLSFFFLLLVLLYSTFFSANHYTSKTIITLNIKRGDSFSKVTDELFKLGVIPSKTNFKIAGWIYSAERKIKPARYIIPNGLSYLDLLDLLISGKGDQLRNVELYDGISLKGIVSRLKQEKILNDDSLIVKANNKIFIMSIGLQQSSLLGYLLPGNYYFYENSQTDEILLELYSSFKSFSNKVFNEEVKNKKLSVHQILTLASIVEGETNKKDEMARIAGVYLNRLKTGMPLQADPTIQFIQPVGWKRLRFRDLKIDSPYNTYKYAGLPPGPINNPGRNAILSVLNPEEHDYFYFVADGSGYHKFSKTFSEHKRLASDYYRLLKKRNDDKSKD